MARAAALRALHGWRRAAALLLVPVLALGLVACGSPDEVSFEVQVVGDGSAPQLQFATPLEVTEASSVVLAEGSGHRLVDGEPVLLDYRLVSAVDGSLIEQTYGSVPKVLRLTPDVLGTELYDALLGVTVGTRLVVFVPPDAEGVQNATVVLVDVRSTRAEGEANDPRPELPEVVLDDMGSPSISIPEGDPPADLVVETLIKGSGAQVAEGATITVQFTGFRWSDGVVVDSTWDRDGPASFTMSGVVKAWPQGLVEQTVGSQVLLVVPPAYGFGGLPDHELADETLVFVVDILAAGPGSPGATEEAPADEAAADPGDTKKDKS